MQNSESQLQRRSVPFEQQRCILLISSSRMRGFNPTLSRPSHAARELPFHSPIQLANALQLQFRFTQIHALLLTRISQIPGCFSYRSILLQTRGFPRGCLSKSQSRSLSFSLLTRCVHISRGAAPASAELHRPPLVVAPTRSAGNRLPRTRTHSR